MKKLLLLLIAGLAFSINSLAQDKVLLKNGTIVAVKVLEVGLEDVKYQLYTKEGDGAIYTVPKSKIELIEYESGLREEFKEITTEMADLTKKHQLGFNYIDLLSQNISFDYEYYLSESREFSLYVPVRIGLPRNSNHYFRANVFEAGLGIFIYPYRKKKLNYFTGLETAYAAKKQSYSTYDNITGFYSSEPIFRDYFGLYVTNGIKLNFKERFGLGYSFSVGMLADLKNGGTEVGGKINMNFFYRF